MVIFGSIGFFSEHTNVPSIELVFVRCLCASLFLGVCWFGSGRYRTEQWNRREVLQTLACGFFLVLNWVFLFKSFEETSVTIAISVYHLAPVLVLLLGSLIYREKLHLISVTSIVICFLGTALISGINGSTSFSQLMGSGIIWAVLAALFYAFTTLAGKGIKHESEVGQWFGLTLPIWSRGRTAASGGLVPTMRIRSRTLSRARDEPNLMSDSMSTGSLTSSMRRKCRLHSSRRHCRVSSSGIKSTQ